MKRILRFLIYCLLSASMMAAGLVIILQRIIETDAIKPELEQGFSDFLTRPLEVETLGWRWFPVPSLVGYNVRIWSRDGHIMAESPEALIRFSFLPLVQKQIVVRDLIFLQPQVTLRRRVDGSFPAADMVRDIRARLDEGKGTAPAGGLKTRLKTISVKSGRLRLIDEKKSPDPLPIGVEINADGTFRNKAFPFDLAAEIVDPPNGGRVTLTGTLQKETHLHAETSDLSIEAVKFLSDYASKWTGRLEGLFDLERQSNQWEWTLKAGSDSLRPKGDKPFPPLKVWFTALSSGEMRAQIRAETQETMIILKAKTRIDDPRRIDLVFLSPRLDMNEAWTWKDAVWGAASSEPVEPIYFSGRGKVDNLTYNGVAFRSLNWDFVFPSTGSARIEPITARGLGGDLEGRVELSYPEDLGSTKTLRALAPPRYLIVWRARDIEGADLSRVFFRKEWFEGKGRSDGYLKGDWTTADIRTVSGRVFVEFQNGRVWGLPGLGKSVSRLNAGALFKDGKELPFQVARATATLTGGKIYFDPPGVFRNENMNVGIMGEADLAAKTIDGKLVFHFLSVVGEVLQAVPGIRTIFYHGRKSMVPIWVSVTGPLANPEVEILSTRSVGETLWGAIGGVLKFPVNIFRGAEE